MGPQQISSHSFLAISSLCYCHAIENGIPPQWHVNIGKKNGIDRMGGGMHSVFMRKTIKRKKHLEVWKRAKQTTLLQSYMGFEETAQLMLPLCSDHLPGEWKLLGGFLVSAIKCCILPPSEVISQMWEGRVFGTAWREYNQLKKSCRPRPKNNSPQQKQG